VVAVELATRFRREFFDRHVVAQAGSVDGRFAYIGESEEEPVIGTMRRIDVHFEGTYRRKGLSERDQFSEAGWYDANFKLICRCALRLDTPEHLSLLAPRRLAQWPCDGYAGYRLIQAAEVVPDDQPAFIEREAKVRPVGDAARREQGKQETYSSHTATHDDYVIGGEGSPLEPLQSAAASRTRSSRSSAPRSARVGRGTTCERPE
jgi:hypothetical protein